MSLQFSRSLRSLNIDSFRASRIGLFLAIGNILLLLIWFSSAKVTLYEVSSELEIANDATLVAQFPAESMARLYPGQSALVRIDAGQDQPLITIPSIVIGVDTKNNKVELLMMTDDLPAGLLEGGVEGKAEVEVEVEYVTPAELVMRASGKFVSKSQVPISPQSLQEKERK